MRKIYYDTYKQLKICTQCGKNSAREDKTTCWECAEIDSQRTRTHNKERKAKYNKRKKELCDALGVCTTCMQRDKYKGKQCIVCYLKRKRKYKEKVAESPLPPRSMFNDLELCAICGKPVEPNYKLCSVHLDIARTNIAKGRIKVDLSNHQWKKDKDCDVKRLQALGCV